MYGAQETKMHLLPTKCKKIMQTSGSFIIEEQAKCMYMLFEVATRFPNYIASILFHVDNVDNEFVIVA